MDAVMLGVAVAAVVDAAPGHDGHETAPLADKEVAIVTMSWNPALLSDRQGYARFALVTGAIFDVDAVLVGLGDDLDMLGVLWRGTPSVHR